jgi:hypothetical protein
LFALLVISLFDTSRSPCQVLIIVSLFGMSLQVDNTKTAASDVAVAIQPVPDRIAYQDHGWLSYELEQQRIE